MLKRIKIKRNPPENSLAAHALSRAQQRRWLNAFLRLPRPTMTRIFSMINDSIQEIVDNCMDPQISISVLHEKRKL